MKSWDEKQEAVDGLFEVIAEKVREKEPVLGKLPEFENMVEKALEQVLRMVQRRIRVVSTSSETEHGDNAAENPIASNAKGGESHGYNDGKSNSLEDNIQDILDVMDFKKEPAVPIFMDLLAIGGQQGQPQSSSSNSLGDDDAPPKHIISEFFTQCNNAGVPNLVYPLNVHHKEGVGRMVEEWELAANKNTKRIMMREAMKEIASVVDSASGENCVRGAARVLVVGKRGVGKVRFIVGCVDPF